MSVGGFSILDNHLHLLVRLDPEEGRFKSVAILDPEALLATCTY